MLFRSAKDPELANMYAGNVLKGPFPKAEDTIAKNPQRSYYYAAYVLKGPFPKGEDAIAKDPLVSLGYARNVLKGPFPKGEDAIATGLKVNAFLYAKDVLKDKKPRTWAKRHLAGETENTNK